MQRSNALLRISILIQFLALAPILSTATAAAADFWVDANTGSDGNPGTELLPFKTITYTITTAGPDATIYVLPGIYDAAHGEVFPIALLSNQALVGDPATKGAGPEPTRIIGKGSYAGLSGLGSLATVLCGPASRVSGFEIDADESELRHAAVVVHGETAVVNDNRMLGACYAGVHLSDANNSEVRDNVFEASSYGVYLSVCPDRPIVEGNVFVSPQLAVDMNGYDTNPWIHANIFQAGSRVGVHVQHGYPRIEGNTFEAGSGGTYGGIYVARIQALPIVRSNSFANALGVRINEGDPDLGTELDPGLNDFTGMVGVCLQHDGDATVDAIGNTWTNDPPILGEDIVISGGGSVNLFPVPVASTGFGRLKASF